MGRLTNDMRETIADRAVKFAFEPRLNALKEAEDILAREAYNFLFSEAEQKAAAKLPDNWLRRDTCLKFNAGGLTIKLDLIGTGLVVPYKAKGSDFGSYGCNNLGVIPVNDLCQRIQAHAQAFERYKDERREAKQSTQRMLNAVNTTKRLREVWPQGLEFFADFDREEVRSLPTVRVDEINAMLGLAEAA